MSATIGQLATEVGADSVQDSTRLQEQLTAAQEIVKKMTIGSTVPASMVDRAELEAAADLWRRNKARTGVPNFDNYDGNPEPVPVLRDPHTSAYTILRPWLTPAIG